MKQRKILLFISIACGFSTLLILYWVLKFSAHRIDFTDEGYHLNLISNPFLYQFSLSQFGFIYHPLFHLVNENIVWFRRLNVIITFGLSFILTYFFIRKIVNKKNINLVYLYLISFGTAISSLTYISTRTPNYNSLTFQALLLTCIGIVLIDKCNLKKNFLSHIIIGLGGWLTFMAKPTSALGLAVIIIIYFFLSKNFNWRFILISILTSIILLVFSAFIIDGSISIFIKRYILSFLHLDLLKGGHGFNKIFRLDKFKLSIKIVFFIASIFLLILFICSNKYKNNYNKNFYLVIIAFFIFLSNSVLALSEINLDPNLRHYKYYLVYGILFACSYIYLKNNKIKFNISQKSNFYLFLFLPYAYVMGSNNNYWIKMGQVWFFFLMASFALIIPRLLKYHKYSSVIVLVLASQFIVSIQIKEGIEKPHRYNEPLRLSQSKIYINNNYFLKLSNEFSNYIKNFRKIASQSGFKNNDPIIDLSGQSPALVYLVNGKSIGTAWNIGGYKGSLDLAKARFNLVDCKEISKAWVILEIKGPRIISTELLNYLGADFPDQYQLMGSWKTAKGAGGYKNPRKQELYKPIKSELIFNSCNKIRKQNN